MLLNRGSKEFMPEGFGAKTIGLKRVGAKTSAPKRVGAKTSAQKRRNQNGTVPVCTDDKRTN